MRRFAHLLVPFDFSETADKALHWALDLGRQLTAEIIVLTVVENVALEGEETPPLSPRETEKKVRHLLKEKIQFLGDVSSRLSEYPPRVFLRSSHPVEEILKIAVEEDIDLIVIGTHGRRGVERLLMGSVAEGVIREAPCPVFVVRENMRLRKYQEPNISEGESIPLSVQKGEKS